MAANHRLISNVDLYVMTYWEAYLPDVDAVLDALMCPTEGMLADVVWQYDRHPDDIPAAAEDVFQQIIRAAKDGA